MTRQESAAALKRRIEKLEALLEAEKTAHARVFAVYREQLWELVDLKLRNERAMQALSGQDEH